MQQINFDQITKTLKNCDNYLDCASSSQSPKSQCVVNTIAVDSRKVTTASLFIAIRGERHDAHEFLDDVIEKLPTVIIIEDRAVFLELKKRSSTNTTMILVKSSRKAWSHLEALLQGNPQEHLQFIGVTGTNGKTSTTQMIYQHLLNMNVESACFGTIEHKIGLKVVPSKHTTPDPDVLFSLLSEIVQTKIKYVIMEVSSHAIAHEKLGPIRFDALGFTSFSQDHLDLHKTIENYFATKCLFFSAYAKPNSYALIFSEVFKKMKKIEFMSATVQSYGYKNSDITFEIIGQNPSGTKIKIKYKDRLIEGVVPYLGAFLIENFICALFLSEFILQKQIKSMDWKSLKPIAGRLEKVTLNARLKKTPTVIVDYAHTPDALERALTACRVFTKGKLIVVFGCGGDRDQSKRPLMASIASRLADNLIVTSDNPRFENPLTIIDQIVQGSDPSFPKNCLVIEQDRKKAIQLSMKIAGSDDTILVAGKGHEQYQQINGQTVEFNDRKIIEDYIS